MTTPTRLAEIAEILDPAIHTRPRINLYKADYEAVYRKAERIVALFTAAQARSREDAEIMRASEKKFSHWATITDANLTKRGCALCGAWVWDDSEENIKPITHTPDCLVTKLRARADELEGRTDG